MHERDEIQDMAGYVNEVVSSIPEEKPPLDGSIDRPLSSPTNMLPSTDEAIRLDAPLGRAWWLAAGSVALLALAGLAAWLM